MRRAYPWRLGRAVFCVAAVLAGCETSAPTPERPPPARTAPAPAPAPAPTAGAPTPRPAAPGTAGDGGALLRPAARWMPAEWADLPGWGGERALEAWGAWRRSCARPAAGWERLCADAAARTPADDASARAWMMLNLSVYRVESPGGSADGLITGYFEPLVDASRTRSAVFRVPIHAPPADLATREPYWTRRQIDTLPEAQAGLRGRAIAWVADPLDALLLQVQGSGRLRFARPGGGTETVRIAFAGHNGQPYASVARWLVDQGEMTREAASWPAVRDWARRHPARVDELLWSNPRVVFFREESLADPESGPRGAQGVALTPGRSIAVDPQSIPYGAMVWLDTTEPLSAAPLRRLVVAQDTGSAITGAVRADYFWGWAPEAEALAGRMKQPLRMWVLWPRS